MDEKAFWISPDGEITPVGRNHISEVIGNPIKFGMTREEIERAYERHGEPLGLEGMAREEIIKNLIGRGWIRIRDYGQYLSVQVRSMDDPTFKQRLLQFIDSGLWPCDAEIDARLGILDEAATRVMSLQTFRSIVTLDNETS